MASSENNKSNLIASRDIAVNKRRVVKVGTTLITIGCLGTISLAGLAYEGLIPGTTYLQEAALTFVGGGLCSISLLALGKELAKHHRLTKNIKLMNTKIREKIENKYQNIELDRTKDYASAITPGADDEYNSIFALPYNQFLKTLAARKEVLQAKREELKKAKVLTKQDSKEMAAQENYITTMEDSYNNYQRRLRNPANMNN